MDQEAQNEFLLYCFGINTEKIDPAKFKELSDKDWNLVIQTANKHRVTPLLFHHFKTTGLIEHVPTEFNQKMHEIYIYNARRNMQVYHELSKVITILRKNDIPVIMLKGAALAESIYQNIALRPMFDVDILIKREDIYNIDRLLTQSGYSSDMESLLLSKRHINWARHIAYINKDIQIEAHLSIHELPNIDPWKNPSSLNNSIFGVYMLGPEDFLLHLCSHLYDHLYIRKESIRLIWWFDIVKLIEHYRDTIDWDYVMQIIEGDPAKVNFYNILYIINNCFKVNMPVGTLNRIKNRAHKISIIGLMNQERPSKPNTDPLLDYIPVASEIPSIGNKIYHVFRLIFPCKNYMIHHYSIKRPDFIYFHYFLRLLRGTTKLFGFLCRLPNRQRNE